MRQPPSRTHSFCLMLFATIFVLNLVAIPCFADTEGWREPSLEWLADTSDAIVIGELTPHGDGRSLSEWDCRIEEVVHPEPESTESEPLVEVGQTITFNRRLNLIHDRNILFEEGDSVIVFLRFNRERILAAFHYININHPRIITNKEPESGEIVRTVRFLAFDKHGLFYEREDAILCVIEQRLQTGRTVPEDCDYARVEDGYSVDGGFFRSRPGPEYDNGYDVVFSILLPPDSEFRAMIELTNGFGFGGRYEAPAILRANYPSAFRDALRETPTREVESPEAIRAVVEVLRSHGAGTMPETSYTTPRTPPSTTHVQQWTEGERGEGMPPTRRYRPSSNGQYLLAESWPGYYRVNPTESLIQLVDVNDGSILFETECLRASFSPCGAYLIGNRLEPQEIFVYDIAAREIILDEEGSVASFSPNGRSFYWTHTDESSRTMYDLEKRKLLFEFSNVRRNYLQFSRDDRRLCFLLEPIDDDFRRLTVWDLESGDQMTRGEIHEKRSVIDPFPNSDYVLLIGDYRLREDQRRFLLNWRTGEIVHEFPAMSTPFAMSPNDRAVAYVQERREENALPLEASIFTLRIYEFASGETLKEIDLPATPERLEFLTEGKTIMAVFTVDPANPTRKTGLLHSIRTDDIQGELIHWTPAKP